MYDPNRLAREVRRLPEMSSKQAAKLIARLEREYARALWGTR